MSVLAVWLTWRLTRRFNAAMLHEGQDLESLLREYNQRVVEVGQELAKLVKLNQELQEKAALASQKISIVRFNPFGDTGGDQSFALAVLDGHDSGYVLTSIHGRTGTRVYAKPIDFGKSKYNLSSEEQKALVQATKRTPAQEVE